MDELLGDFITETRETLEAIAGEIVAWESDPADRARLDAIFRFVHTVKGSCGFLDLPRLGRLSHAAEDALAEVRDGRRVADQRLVSGVLAIIDRIGELAEAIESGDGLPDGEDHLLIAALEDVAGSAPAPVAAAPHSGRAVARSIRVPVELLDRMMAGVSELVLARNELGRRLRDVAAVAHDAAFERLSTTIGDLREMVTRTRMARVDHLFAALPRLVRDLSAELGKQVKLTIDGGDVELDREMIEMIRDPLAHIMRNAIDHGFETPDARRAAGKAPAGALSVSARQSGNQILIEIVDDGRGVNGERLAQKAVAAGLMTQGEAARLPWAQKLALMFHPGLSTAAAVTAVSGRGVGMDVVRANVERLGGLIEVHSRPGEGTRLVLRVPLTLTIIPALTVSVAACSFALPRSAIEEIVRVGRGNVVAAHVAGRRVATVRGRRLPVVELAALLGCGVEDGALLVVIRAPGGMRYALAVDAVHDHEELVVKPAAPAVMATGLYAGVTLPDDNRPMLLLDLAGIAVAGGVRAGGAAPAEAAPAAEEEARGVPSLMFRALDGVVRAVRVALVERIEDVPAAAAHMAGGRMRLAHDGALVPLLLDAPPGDAARLRVLRLSDGTRKLALGIAQVIDIVPLPPPVVQGAGTIAGIALVDGRPVELIDAYALFAAADPAVAVAARPLAVIAEAHADGWLREVLRPRLESIGYRVALPGDADAEAAELIVVPGAASPPEGAGGRVVRIADARAPGVGIDRYDRAALLAALATRAGSG